MGAAVIKSNDFPEIVQVYNNEGRKAAYRFIRDTYGVKNGCSVIHRIQAHSDYIYDEGQDKFVDRRDSAGDGAFLSLDELCRKPDGHQAIVRNSESRQHMIERLIHELMSDRLLELGKYIIIDQTERTVVIDRSSLIASGYTIINH